MNWIARIAPQRSTQYTALAEALAAPELRLSPLAPLLRAVEPVKLSGHSYLRVELAAPPERLPAFATLPEWFEWWDQLGGQAGPFLRPLEGYEPLGFGDELVEARRYRGKTNELFTHFLVNVARWTHGGAPRWLLDPLAGGGTTLFVGLRLGLDVLGIEQDKQALSGTDSFLREYLQEARLKHRRESQKRKVGPRTLYELPQSGRRVVLAQGDAREAELLLEALPGAPRPDLLVTDLPYAIQHGARGPFRSLMDEALPAWQRLAAPGAVLAMAWNATTLPRERLLEWVVASGWQPLAQPPFDALAHRVDRVIKQRDVVVARKQPTAAEGDSAKSPLAAHLPHPASAAGRESAP